MDNLKEYWSNSLPDRNLNTNRVVAVDILFEHPGTNNNCLLVYLLLNKLSSARSIGILDYGVRSRLKRFASNYFVTDFESVYKLSNVLLYKKAIKMFLSVNSSLKYKKEFGISVVVDGQEIGDLIYDQYMRIYSLPRVVKVNLSYRIFVFKSVFLYLCYREILKKRKVTDLVVSHNVYAKYGLMARAAASLDQGINVWQWFGLSPMNISKHIARRSYIRMPRYFEESIKKRIQEKYSDDEILKMYSYYAGKRYSAQDDNQIDLAFVYKENNISSVEMFRQKYQVKGRCYFIFSHAFVDAVKYTDWQVYSDYYTWLENTLIILAECSARNSYFVKPHPSESLYPCDETVERLVDRINRKYSASFIFIDDSVCNTAIFKMADAVITCSGSVAMEAPCFGVPCLIASSSLFENSQGVIQAKDETEYSYLLENLDSVEKLESEAVLDAKVMFLWFSQFTYCKADFLTITNSSPKAGYQESCSLIDGSYVGARRVEDQELYCRLEMMSESDSFDIDSI